MKDELNPHWRLPTVEGRAQIRRTPSLKEGLVMKRLNLFLASFLTVFTVGCATMTVDPVKNPIVHNSLMDKRIKNAVDRELTEIGYQKQSEKIVYHSGLRDVQTGDMVNTRSETRYTPPR